MSYIYILYKEATFLPTNIRIGCKCMTVSSALSYYSVVFNYLGKKFGPLLVEAPTLTQWKNDKDTCLQHCQISTYLGYS